MEHWRALEMKKQQWRLKEMEEDGAICGSMELTVIISDFPQESEHINGLKLSWEFVVHGTLLKGNCLDYVFERKCNDMLLKRKAPWLSQQGWLAFKCDTAHDASWPDVKASVLGDTVGEDVVDILTITQRRLRRCGIGLKALAETKAPWLSQQGWMAFNCDTTHDASWAGQRRKTQHLVQRARNLFFYLEPQRARNLFSVSSH
ncbi:hypothetical protein Lal_00039701 [Lupinus albus]|nr:hypothetical protein Lal_00039701 [Lupinus albus]